MLAVLRHGKVKRTDLVVGADWYVELGALAAELSCDPELLWDTAQSSAKQGIRRFEGCMWDHMRFLRATGKHSVEVVVGAVGDVDVPPSVQAA